MTAAEAAAVVASATTEVVALAQHVAFAVRVDPALLRAARLELFPASDAGLEADLWLSPMVRFPMPSGITLDDQIGRRAAPPVLDHRSRQL